jgi:hypothetical protein
MPATREDLVKIAREVVTGPNRPSYCENPAAFDPHEWVLEAMQRAYLRGRRDGVIQGNSQDSGLYPEGG